MASLRLQLLVDVDGVPATWLAPNGRIVRRYEVDESVAFNYTVANADSVATIPSSPAIDSIQCLLLVPEAEMDFFLDGSTTQVVIGANGILLVAGATIDVGHATNCTVDNNSGGDANLKGIAAGT
jgi:hypothetical protein